VNISTRLKLTGLFSAAAIMAIGVVLLSATQQVKQELVKNEEAGEVLGGVTALRYLTLEYVLRHDERPHAQWQLRYASLSRLLTNKTNFTDTEEREIIDDLRHTQESVGVLFSQLVADYEDGDSTKGASAILEELQARLVGQITNKTQAMISDALSLSERSRTGVMEAQWRASVAVASFAGIVVLVIAATMFLVLRSVVGPLGKLREGTEIVGAGNLDYLLNATAKDELGELARAFDGMTAKLKGTTVSRDELVVANVGLQSEMAVRRQAEQKVQAQLERLNLLHQITRAIGERQDLDSIFQVVVRSLEDQLPADFCCLCLYDATDHKLTVARVGFKSGALASELAMPERARIDIDENGLSRCVGGQLVYEPDIAQVAFPFPRRLAQGGLRSLVMAPLPVESQVFGVLVVARVQAEDFSSGECEFLRQLSEHVALAAHQSQLYGALQQAYDDLRQTQQVVMQQERLRALGQMASGIAHDINNALSPVALYTQTLLEVEPNLSPRARDYLETIQRAVEDVAQTVARMREFYRQREPQLSLVPVHLNDLVRQVVNLTRARWSDMPQQQGIVIDLRTELANGPPAILGVESEIREALTNLILNAVDALPNGGVLTLRTKVPGGLASGKHGYVQVEVADDGVGMDEKTQRRCLEPFFTTKGERGTGLGLAMAYGAVKRHGAEIDIRSAPGEGTIVCLSFPLPSEITAVADQSVPVHAVLSRLRLLVIDDDPLLLKSLRDALEADGHIVTIANDGQAGIDTFRAARERGEMFAAVITDLGMPYVDGRKVAGAVKDTSPSTPVIMLTGWGQRLVAEGDIPLHVDRVLSKPPKLRELRETLAHCCQPDALSVL
jgi:signal transduction histidine kinase/ActR/RegA family two-component response regulator/HAMP domain-containing protein